jgi:hypothetical protein
MPFIGTKSFHVNDWKTNFHFSWYQHSQIKMAHLGVLEDLGLEKEIFLAH